MVFAGFRIASIELDATTIFARVGGTGPPLLLLHGFPQTHVMWRDIAAALAPRFTVIAADLRGYGQSGCPASSADHAPYAKRAMARDMVLVMKRLGFEQFMAAGHDRGGRVAYRWRSTTPIKCPRLPSSMSSPRPPRGTGRTLGWLSASGPGACLRNRSLCRSG